MQINFLLFTRLHDYIPDTKPLMAKSGKMKTKSLATQLNH